MPKDSAPTRSAILAAALQTLKRDGLEGFAISTVDEAEAKQVFEYLRRMGELEEIGGSNE